MSAGDLELYESGGYVIYEGRPLAELINFRVRYRSGDNPVRTIRRGLSGFTNGPDEVEIDAENAIPKAGLEAAFDEAIEQKKTIEIVWKRAGKRKRAKGRLTELDESYQTDTAASMNWTFMGKLVTTVA